MSTTDWMHASGHDQRLARGKGGYRLDRSDSWHPMWWSVSYSAQPRVPATLVAKASAQYIEWATRQTASQLSKAHVFSSGENKKAAQIQSHAQLT